MFFYIVKNRFYSAALLFISLANVLVMALWHFGQSDEWLSALVWANVGFVTVYIGDVVMKVIALGPEGYW